MLFRSIDYAVEEVESLIKPTDVEPCDKLGTEELGVSALRSEERRVGKEELGV